MRSTGIRIKRLTVRRIHGPAMNAVAVQ
jgi:hypothetical protein